MDLDICTHFFVDNKSTTWVDICLYYQIEKKKSLILLYFVLSENILFNPLNMFWMQEWIAKND